MASLGLQRGTVENFGDRIVAIEQEVLEELANRIDDPKKIDLQVPHGGFRIDMVVKPKNEGGKPIAIECDGATYHSTNEAVSWDIFCQKLLEDQGFVFIRIYSTNWWQDKNTEVEILVDKIRQLDLA